MHEACAVLVVMEDCALIDSAVEHMVQVHDSRIHWRCGTYDVPHGAVWIVDAAAGYNGGITATYDSASLSGGCIGR